MLRRLVPDRLSPIAILALITCAVWIALVSANTDEAMMSTKFEEVAGPGFKGVVVPEDVASRYWQFARGREPDDTWEAGDVHIAEMEAGLADYFRNHNDQDVVAVTEKLHDYKRQYFAVVDQGQRKIELVAMCHHYVAENNIDFMKELPLVSDGGDCFFEVLYNVDERSFVWARIHGEG